MVVCGNKEHIPWGEHGVEDCCTAIENMLIAATAMGLGSVGIGGFNQSTMRTLLDIPEHVFPISVVYFGYPTEKKDRRTKYVEEAIYWQICDPSRKHKPRPCTLIAEKI